MIDAMGARCADDNGLWITGHFFVREIRIELFPATHEGLGSYPRALQEGVVDERIIGYYRS